MNKKATAIASKNSTKVDNHKVTNNDNKLISKDSRFSYVVGCKSDNQQSAVY